MQTHEKTKISGGLSHFSTMRRKEKGSKKGGGIKVIMPKSNDINLQKIDNKSTEILELEGDLYGMGVKIIVVYFDANKNRKGNEANDKIRQDVEKLIENNEQEALMVLGDFNGHLKILDGRENDRNGRMIMEWVESYGLVILNLDEKCKGTYTWSRGDSKTAIDYILVNDNFYKIFEKMEIDENKDWFADSDHHLVSGFFRVDRRGGSNYNNRNRWKTGEYFRKDEEALINFRRELE